MACLSTGKSWKLCQTDVFPARQDPNRQLTWILRIYRAGNRYADADHVGWSRSMDAAGDEPHEHAQGTVRVVLDIVGAVEDGVGSAVDIRCED